MFIGTHTLLPVCLALGFENGFLAVRRRELFPEWALPVIGLFGALPDLCTPHLSLAARYSSWSHTLVFLAALIPLAAGLAGFFPKGTRLRMAGAMWGAAFLHLATDALSGGVPWLLPWSDDILGGRHIPYPLWIWSELFFVVLTGLFLILRHRLRALPARREPG